MVNGEYRGQQGHTTSSAETSYTRTPTLNQWIQTLVNREYTKTANLAQVAERLQVDRRTVKKYLDLKT
jgi:transcriptional regulator GlxA family with amidase domain